MGIVGNYFHKAIELCRSTLYQRQRLRSQRQALYMRPYRHRDCRRLITGIRLHRQNSLTRFQCNRFPARVVGSHTHHLRIATRPLDSHVVVRVYFIFKGYRTTRIDRLYGVLHTDATDNSFHRHRYILRQLRVIN